MAQERQHSLYSQQNRYVRQNPTWVLSDVAGPLRVEEFDHEVAEKGCEHDDRMALWRQYAIRRKGLGANHAQSRSDF
ncbi:MAG TPA: hypothetical protein VLI39_21220 [Sedimentisphaerales bacterium]|nr:hypothetical protein [Sedimentisphaerales bacterium]